jgi:hypothetical protein
MAVDIVAAAGSTQAAAEGNRVVEEDIPAAAGDIRAAAEDILAVEVGTGAAGTAPAATARKRIRRTPSDRNTLLRGPGCMKRIFWT